MLDYETDNRDVHETWLWTVEDRDYLRVFPWELVENIITNTSVHDEYKKVLKDKLKALRDEVLEKMDQKERDND